MHITYDAEAVFNLERNQNVLSCKKNSTMDTNCNDTEVDNRPCCMSPHYYHGCVRASFQGCISISSMSSNHLQSQSCSQSLPKNGNMSSNSKARKPDISTSEVSKSSTAIVEDNELSPLSQSLKKNNITNSTGFLKETNGSKCLANMAINKSSRSVDFSDVNHSGDIKPVCDFGLAKVSFVDVKCVSHSLHYLKKGSNAKMDCKELNSASTLNLSTHLSGETKKGKEPQEFVPDTDTEILVSDILKSRDGEPIIDHFQIVISLPKTQYNQLDIIRKKSISINSLVGGQDRPQCTQDELTPTKKVTVYSSVLILEINLNCSSEAIKSFSCHY